MQQAARRGRRLTWVIAACTIAVLVAASPGALRDAWERGGLYVFSWEFLEDLPRRLTGPGRMRFVFQPIAAVLLGIRAGRRDARAGRLPYLLALLADPRHRRGMLAESAHDLVNILLVGILLDTVAQWLILGVAHPVAAIIVGPVLVALPYAFARALSNRMTRPVSR